MNYSNIKTLQINLNRSAVATESALDLAIGLEVGIIAVQEPWVFPSLNNDYTTTRSVVHQGYTQILPNHGSLRPRTLFYISKALSFISIAHDSPQDPDCLIIDINKGNSKIQLINIYNEKDLNGAGIYTIDRGLIPSPLYQYSIILGDFNTHHPWWDPLHDKSPNADNLVDWITASNLQLLNSPGIGTFYRPHMETPTVIDLTLNTSSLVNQIQDWQTLPDLGSDHFGILFSITSATSTTSTNSANTRFNTKLADWDLFKKSLVLKISESSLLSQLDLNRGLREDLSNLGLQPDDLDQKMDLMASTLTKAIIDASNASIPRTSTSAKSKPWWTDEIRQLRKNLTSISRKAKKNPYFHQEYQNAKNRYFNKIKKAKIDHWNKFLSKEDPKSIFKAMSYTKEVQIQPIPGIKDLESNIIKTDFTGKCEALRSALFPSPPSAPEVDLSGYTPSPYWDWPSLSQIELQTACTTKPKGKTPGPDLITQEIITHAYNTIPEVFFSIYSILINTGYHPKPWKQAVGYILKKPNKPDYSAPKAYRVISLLNCLGKVSERILAQRLSYLAETTHLLHPTQLGGRLKKSAIDTALLLTNEVEQNKLLGLKTSTVFLDVKGAFDHVAKNQLLAILRDLKLPLSLIHWTSSFLDNRLIKLSFNQNTESFKPINTGIPQGSPISPILFLIYIRGLFISPGVKYLSYIDDISITTSSMSYYRNIRVLEREVDRLFLAGQQNAISFDIAKTELIHFSSTKEAKKHCLKLPNDSSIQPKALVKWLGVYFDRNLTFKEHVAIRTSQAKSAYLRMARLANSERGLTPFALRQLYLACIVSVADYGSIIWWRGQKSLIRPLQAIQNLGLRKILGVFKTAPIIPLEVESALVPPSIRLNTNIRQYAFRLLKLSPRHPVNTEITRFQEIQEDEDLAAQFTKPIQIERIYTSINGLVDSSTLEQIQHFKYPPWNRQTPFLIKIDKSPKDEAAKNHISQLATITSNRTKSIYTDASSIPEQTGIGAGFIVFENTPTSPIYSKDWNIGNQQIVYNGELDGITKASEYASSRARPGDQFNIYSDNQAGIHRLARISDNPGQASQIRVIEASNRIVSQGATITIHWVPGHADVLGNELADKLAKAATKKPPESSTTSFALLGLKIQELRTSEWKQAIRDYENKLRKAKHNNPQAYSSTYYWKLGKKLCLPQGTSRQVASSFYQLKTGHGYLKDYLYRIKRTKNPDCRCSKPETAQHLLLDCRALANERRLIKESLGTKALSLPLLLHTTAGIEQSLKLIKSTQICSRPWHLARKEPWDDE